MPPSKTQDHAAVEKQQTKPGRKPLTSEPKNKRTAQNRAAQRAFRERKERRMQELEEKVRALEQEKVQIANESELLRIQVKSLMSQLGRTRNHNNQGDNSDNLVRPSRERLEKDDNLSVRRDSSSDEKSTNNISSNSSVSSVTPMSLTSEDLYNLPKALSGNTNEQTSTDYSLNLANKMNNKSFKDHYDEQIFCKELGEVCGSTSCPIPKGKQGQSSSASPGTVLSNRNYNSGLSVISNESNNTSGSSNNIAFQSTPPMTTPSVDSSAMSNNAKSPFTNSLFDGSINGDLNILTDLNKDESKLKEDTKVNNNSIWNIGKGLDSYAFLDSDKSNEMDFLFGDEKKTITGTNNLIQSHPEAFQLDANSSLFNNNFSADLDAEVDFENDDVFDDLLKLPYDDINFNNQLNDFDGKENDIVNSNVLNTKNSGEGADLGSDDNEKVPDTTQNLMKCSQIWERITTHPRFTDLDIDNLCDELKLKAKCSESGVVVDGSDVGKLLHQATCEKQKQKEKEREAAIRRAAIDSGSNAFLNGFW